MEIQVETRDVRGLLASPLVRGLWEQMSDGALAINARTREIVAMNAKAQQLLGYSVEQVVGCQCRKMMNSPACTLSCPLTALLEGRRDDSQLALYYRGRDGSKLLHAQTRMLLLRGPDGAPLLGIELFKDLREVQALQRALGERRALVGVIGRSEVMQRLYRMVEQIAPYDIPVLLTGASGVGKERFAEALQHLSHRAEGPFVKVNCAALSPTLVESELFGHKKGAFTGACRTRRGYLEEADGGTLLLDEIGDLPLPLQSKLLRFLQEGELQRLGEEQVRKVDVRVLAATNRSLDAEIKAGRFRADLYYRLLGAHLQIPPLRERRDDIPLLAAHFLDRFAEEHPALEPARLSPAALSLLTSYQWPGNVRELAHVLRLGAIQAQPSGELLPSHLAIPGGQLAAAAPATLPLPVDTPASSEPAAPAPILPLAVVEQLAIERAMAHTKGNLSAAARLLGVDRSTLWRKQKKS